MAFHFLSHGWRVTDLTDGIMVGISQQDLDQNTIAVLDDELVELVSESGHSQLHVNLEEVRFLTSAALGKLISLDAMLRKIDCRLVLCNIDLCLNQSLQATRLAESIDRSSLRV